MKVYITQDMFTPGSTQERKKVILCLPRPTVEPGMWERKYLDMNRLHLVV